MRCPEFRSQQLSWLDAALDPSRAEAMRAHADACPACATYDRQVRAGLLLARHLPPLRPSPKLRRALRALGTRATTPIATPVATPVAAESGAPRTAIFPPYGTRDDEGVQGRARDRAAGPRLPVPRHG
ncbi:MAG: zf-HC2 domain-containing protein [Gemmatimonadaceae bacterium]|nr:zf-HC2 domain-containing protein [Gemmatimonadaceae bacterium]